MPVTDEQLEQEHRKVMEETVRKADPLTIFTIPPDWTLKDVCEVYPRSGLRHKEALRKRLTSQNRDN